MTLKINGEGLGSPYILLIMRINITGRLAGYSYAEGEQDIPKEHAQLFLDAEKASLPESKSSADYTVTEVREMVKEMGEDEKKEFTKNDDRKTVKNL